jgi:hypothetical protein
MARRLKGADRLASLVAVGPWRSAPCWANQDVDTRTLQDYLAHRNIEHTVRSTELSASKFKNLWPDQGPYQLGLILPPRRCARRRRQWCQPRRHQDVGGTKAHNGT